jgi:hypothetical protein
VIDSDLVAAVNSNDTAGAADSDDSDRETALSPDVTVWAADGSDGVVVIDMTCSGMTDLR